MTVLADQPELVALGNLASVPPSRMALAFNDPEHFFEHLTLDELGRLKDACERLALMQQTMTEAMDGYIAEAKRILEVVPEAENAD